MLSKESLTLIKRTIVRVVWSKLLNSCFIILNSEAQDIYTLRAVKSNRDYVIWPFICRSTELWGEMFIAARTCSESPMSHPGRENRPGSDLALQNAALTSYGILALWDRPFRSLCISHFLCDILECNATLHKTIK